MPEREPRPIPEPEPEQPKKESTTEQELSPEALDKIMDK